MIGFEMKVSKTRLLIGIDPVSTCGMATLIPNSKCLNLYEFDSNIQAMFQVIELSNDYEIELFIEDARLYKKSGFHAKTSDKGRLQGVGYVKGYSKEWEAFCRLKMFRFNLLQAKNTKVSPDFFEKLTGLKTLKTQTHMRDAAMIIFGRS